MELTKQEKHEIYKQCLIDIESMNNIFCCASFVNQLKTVMFESRKVFSELYELRTIENHVLWFNNRQERIDALKKCIEITK